MRIPLEDDFGDILGKAQRGLNLPGERDPARLGLNASALRAIAAGTWYPNDPGAITGFAMFTTPFCGMTVNSYVVFDPATREAAAFDTGTDCTGMLALKVNLRQVFLTHIHGDHIADLVQLNLPAFVSAREPLTGTESFADDREFQIGSLRVQPRRTSGHTHGGTSYVVTGLARRLVFTGDALFAGSMGGAMVNYQEALRTNRESVFSLPANTVICPGHGPLTTVGEEQQHNPFFATPTKTACK